MRNLILFLKKINALLLFLVLEGISLYFFFSKDTYMLSRCMLISKNLTVATDRLTSSFESYMSLNRQNEELADFNAKIIAENLKLKTLLTDSEVSVNETELPVVCAAKVLKNELNYNNNFLVLNKGEKHGVREGMSVLDEHGIVGFVSNTSSSFSIAVSIFNTDEFLTSVKLAGTNCVGSLSWDGKKTGMLQMTEIPSNTDVHVGDTVLTSSYSNIFLENMPVGRVTDCRITDGMYYCADVEVFADMSKLDYVFLIDVKGRHERDSLESVSGLTKDFDSRLR